MSDALFLLDTNIVLTLVRGNTLATHIDTTYGLRHSKVRPIVCVVTHGEVRVLAKRNGWGQKKLDALQDALDNLVTVNINHPDVLDAYVDIDIYSQNDPAGARNMGKNDLWIAACARAGGAELITTDKDFPHLDPVLLTVHYVDPKMSVQAPSAPPLP